MSVFKVRHYLLSYTKNDFCRYKKKLSCLCKYFWHFPAIITKRVLLRLTVRFMAKKCSKKIIKGRINNYPLKNIFASRPISKKNHAWFHEFAIFKKHCVLFLPCNNEPYEIYNLRLPLRIIAAVVPRLVGRACSAAA